MAANHGDILLEIIEFDTDIDLEKIAKISIKTYKFVPELLELLFLLQKQHFSVNIPYQKDKYG